MKIFCALIVAIVATSVSAKAIDTLSPVDARFLDALTNALTQVINQVVMPAVNNSLQDLAAIAAQLTAGVAVGGLDALLGLIGKREVIQLDRGFWDQLLAGLTAVGSQVVLPAVNNSLQDLAAIAAQLTAGVAVGGLDALLGLVGKREIVLDRGFWDQLLAGLTAVGSQVVLPAVNNSLQDLAAIAAQLTAGVAVGGLDALLGLVGKREVIELDRGFWDQLLAGLTTVGSQVILPAVNNSLQDLAAIAAQLTAGVAVGGLDALLGLVGKREIVLDRGFWDQLLAGLTTVGSQVILPAVNNSLQDLAAIAAQLTAGVAVGGLDALLGLVGKRSAEDEARFLDALTNALTQVINQVVMPAVNNSLQDLAAIAAQLTAGVAVGGLDALLGLIGKRNL